MNDMLEILVSHPSSFISLGLAVIVAILIAFMMVLRTGRSIKIKNHIFIEGRNEMGLPNVKDLKHAFQRQMVADMKMSYMEQVRSIKDVKYSEALNWENEFLKRVSALYKGADRVYAVTLSSVSNFWISESDRQLILRYLECQEGIEIHRLFVFESPYDLIRFEEVLRSNYKAYGMQGGVYITSSQIYQAKILNQFCDQKSGYRLIDRDFGIWESDITLFATLQGTQLSFNEINPEQLESIDVQGFKNIFRTLPNGVVKWEADTSASDLANEIFPEDLSYVGPVVHLVFLKHEDREILEEIANRVIELDEIQREALDQGVSINFKQDESWWGINLGLLEEIPAFLDGKCGGKLHCDHEYQYVLLIELPSIGDLREWYRYERHSDVREAIYTKLVTKTKEIYEVMRSNRRNDPAKFEEIESYVRNSGKFKRMDFIFNKQLKDIQPFKIYDQYCQRSVKNSQ